jgi:hypothetical protein
VTCGFPDFGEWLRRACKGFRGVNAAVELIGACGAGRVGVVDDGLVGHEQSDHICQLSGMREIDGVLRRRGGARFPTLAAGEGLSRMQLAVQPDARVAQ